MKAIVFLAILLAGCEPKPVAIVAPTPEPSPTPTWMTIEKESEWDCPDSPEQVIITIRTRDGSKWVATWEKTR
jgi:hypothetical protein